MKPSLKVCQKFDLLRAIVFFFLNDTATPEIYPLPLHAALPISITRGNTPWQCAAPCCPAWPPAPPLLFWLPSPGPRARLPTIPDRKSTRLNSSHVRISYAVFCLEKKKSTQLLNHNQSTRFTATA